MDDLKLQLRQGRFRPAVWQGTVHTVYLRPTYTCVSGTTPERNAPRHNVNLQLLLVIANDCSSQALGPTLLSLGDLAVFGETHLAYDGGGVPAIATAGCGHVLDDRPNGCQDRHRGRAVDPVADCLRCRLASVTDAALMLLRSRRCLELVGAPWWCLGIFRGRKGLYTWLARVQRWR